MMLKQFFPWSWITLLFMSFLTGAMADEADVTERLE